MQKGKNKVHIRRQLGARRFRLTSTGMKTEGGNSGGGSRHSDDMRGGCWSQTVG